MKRSQIELIENLVNLSRAVPQQPKGRTQPDTDPITVNHVSLAEYIVRKAGEQTPYNRHLLHEAASQFFGYHRKGLDAGQLSQILLPKLTIFRHQPIVIAQISVMYIDIFDGFETFDKYINSIEVQQFRTAVAQILINLEAGSRDNLMISLAAYAVVGMQRYFDYAKDEAGATKNRAKLWRDVQLIAENKHW